MKIPSLSLSLTTGVKVERQQQQEQQQEHQSGVNLNPADGGGYSSALAARQSQVHVVHRHLKKETAKKGFIKKKHS